MTERHIRLGKTDGFRYLGVLPPLTMEQITLLPHVRFGDGEYDVLPFSVQSQVDGSQTIGVFSWPFDKRDRDGLARPDLKDDKGTEKFIEYAQALARQIGGVTLDPEVRPVGPGSLFAQEEPTD